MSAQSVHVRSFMLPQNAVALETPEALLVKDFIIRLDLLQRIDLLLAAFAHVHAGRLDFLYDYYVKRKPCSRIYSREYSVIKPDKACVC